VEVLDPAIVDKALAAGIGWERQGSELVKVHIGRNFADALAYVNAVGELAERADHHPDIDIRWNKVTLRLSTHSAGGITEADLSLARQVDDLPGSAA
jgi:4a-hydroxytetrahydrobiopterin dehydratase